ncbi:MAG: S8 family peptidase, partial [Gammaproteobacteria bacterium]|nr:S8 family peptidase [Gammaproteobacteria bacterium]
MSLRKTFIQFFTALLISSMSVATQAQSTVAVLDTGTNAGAIPNNLAPGDFDFVNNDPDPADDSPDNHGTAIAQVIVTTDPKTQILTVKTISGDFTPNLAAIDAGYAHATANPNVRIINHSIGNLNAASPAVIIAAAEAGKLIIVSAGNNGLSNPGGDARTIPALGGRGIIVGASEGGQISVFSNRAGDLADHYVTANPRNSFTQSVGTSMATARVTGVAASIFNQAPFLEPGEVAEIIFMSATDLGAPGVDDIYGHGELNPERALSGLGELEADDGGGGGGSSGALAAVAIGGGIAYAVIRRNKSLKKTVLLDQFGRGYVYDMTKRIHAPEDKPSLLSILSGGEVETASQVINADQSSQLIATVSRFDENTLVLDPAYTDLFSTEQDLLDQSQVSMTLSGGNSKGQYYQFGINEHAKSGFGALSNLATENVSPGFLSNDNFSAPYFGFTDQGFSSQFGRKFDTALSYKFGFASLEDNELFGLESDSALFEGTLTRDRLKLNLQIGQLNEQGSLFGGSSGGAFSVDKNKTLSLGISGTYSLNDRFTLLGSYTEGYSRIDQQDNALLRDFTSVRSNAFGLGFVAKDLIKRGDQFGLALSQPLRVTQGVAEIDIPIAQ